MRLGRALLFVLACWAPAALGSNAALFWTINGGLAAITLLCVLLADQQEAEKTLDWRSLALLLGCAIGLIGWMLLQGLGSIESLRHPIWATLRPIGQFHQAPSIAPDLTLTAATKFATLVAAALAAAIIAASDRDSRFILVALLVSATIIAAYGLLLTLFQSDTILWMPKWAYEGFLTGTFINRNHAATFFGMGLAVALSLLFSDEIPPNRVRPAHQNPSSMIWRGTLIAACAILFMALIRTGSRAGAAASVVGAASVVIIATWRTRNRSRVSFQATAAVGVAIILSLILGKPVLDRIFEFGLGLGDRHHVYRDTLAALADRPILGHGAGTFSDVFPIYRGPELSPDLSWFSAHNTYLDAAVGIGLPAFAVAMLLLLTVIFIILRPIVHLDAPLSPAPVAALAASFLAAGHSFFDFSLETQGVALPFAILLGAGIGEALSPMPQNDASTAAAVGGGARLFTGSRAKPATLILAGILLLLLTAGVVRLGFVVWGTPPSSWLGGARTLASRDAGFSAEAAERAEAASDFVTSRTFFPARYGDCTRWPDSARGLDACLALVDQTLAMVPASGELWLEKARLSVLSGRQASALAALANAHAAAPYEGWLALRRARLLLSADLSLPEDLQQALRQDIEVILRSSQLSAGIAREFATDAVVRAELTALLEQSPNVAGVLRFIRTVRSRR